MHKKLSIFYFLNRNIFLIHSSINVKVFNICFRWDTKLLINWEILRITMYVNKNYLADVFIRTHSYLQHFKLLRPLIQNFLYHVWKKQKKKIYDMIVMSAKFYSEKLFIHIVFSRIDLSAVIYTLGCFLSIFFDIWNTYKNMLSLLILSKQFLPVTYLCNKKHMDNIVACFETLDNIFAIVVRLY